MEVLLNIPEDISKYIEYIPRDLLSEILLDLIQVGINSKQSSGISENKSSLDLSAIATILQTLQLPQKESIREECKQEALQSTPNEFKFEVCKDDASMDDLDDLLDLMK